MKPNKLLTTIFAILFLDIYLIIDTGYLSGDLVATKNPVLDTTNFIFELIKYVSPLLILFYLSKNKNVEISKKLKKTLEIIIILKIISAWFFSYGLVGSIEKNSAPFIIALILPFIGRVSNIVILSLLIFNKTTRKENIKYIFIFTLLAFVTNSFLPIFILGIGLLTKLEIKKYIFAITISIFLFTSFNGVLRNFYEIRESFRNNQEININFENNDESKTVNKVLTGRLTGLSSWLYHDSIKNKVYQLGRYNNASGIEVFNDIIIYFYPTKKTTLISNLYSQAVDPFVGNSYGIMMGSFLPSIIYTTNFNYLITFLYIIFLVLLIYFISYTFKIRAINAPQNAIFFCLYFAFISGALYELLNIAISLILINIYTKIKLTI